MSDVTDEVVTGGHAGIDPQARVASLAQRLAANPDKLGLHLRLAQALDEAGRLHEALKVSGETVVRFPANNVAKARYEALRARADAAAKTSSPALPVQPAPPELAPAAPLQVAEAELADTASERRFAAQDELLHLAQAAGGVSASAPAPATLQAEPSLRLRLNPLRPRYRAEIYVAAGLIAVIALSGLLAWRSPRSGLLIDHDAPTPIVLAPAPSPATPPPAAPATEAAPVPPPPAALHEAAPRQVASSLAAPPPQSVAGTPPPAAAPPAAPAYPALPATTALADVALVVPSTDTHTQHVAADYAARLRSAGITVHPAPVARTSQPAGVVYFYAEDAALARSVAAALDGAAGQPRQAALPDAGDVMPGAIRITLPATSRPPSHGDRP